MFRSVRAVPHDIERESDPRERLPLHGELLRTLVNGAPHGFRLRLDLASGPAGAYELVIKLKTAKA